MGLQGCSLESQAAGEPIPCAQAAKARPAKSYIEEGSLFGSLPFKHFQACKVLTSFSLPSFEHCQLVKSF